MNKFVLCILAISLTSCSHQFREKNVLAVPPLFMEEYIEYHESIQENSSEIPKIIK